MQTLSGLTHHIKLDFDMSSDVSSLFSSAVEWDQSSRDGSNTSGPCATNYLDPFILHLPCTNGQYALNTVIEQIEPADQHSKVASGRKRAAASAFNEVLLDRDMTWQPAFTATNTRTSGPQDPNTITPLQTHFDYNVSFSSSGWDFSTDGHISSTDSAKSGHWHDAIEGEKISVKRRCNRLKRKNNTEPPTAVALMPIGRPGFENVEAESARATYLEKNHKAASKCRRKQKKQQEERIKAAREVERKNEVLKVEVEFLKSSMRELMVLVGKHTDCSDTRLRIYVQREADRLIDGGVKAPVSEFISPEKSASAMENHLRSNLQALSLSQYIDVLEKNGFISWATLSRVQEEDFCHLGVKLGHRRRLQRELASMRGIPPWKPIDSSYPTEQGASMPADTSSTQSLTSPISPGSILE